ncbi:MAG: hypothetical protein PVI07_19505 [Anaerolineae bacterium]|jgi:hypothetical protein
MPEYAVRPEAVVPGRFYPAPSEQCQCLLKTKIVTFYEDYIIPGGIGVSSGVYTDVDGYRYINIFVEFEQQQAAEDPVSLGVIFAFSPGGKGGSRRYFTFEENFAGAADPQMITVTGKNSWHGAQHKKSSYTARLPIMGPYVQVFPFNHEEKDRKLSVIAYLTT